MFILVTGGSGSGKSAYAERILAARPEKKENRYYIATMLPYGEEGKKRVERHRRQREGLSFRTIERYLDLSGVEIPKDSDVLLECMSNLTANEMFDENGSGHGTADAIVSGVQKLCGQVSCLVIVTNEVFSDGATYASETVEYLKCLGEINRRMAELADTVVEVVCGIPVCQKGELPCI